MVFATTMTVQRKKRDNDNDDDDDDEKKILLLSGSRQQLLILLLRRRHRVLPLVFAFSGCFVLLLFVAFSVFSSPPVNHHSNLQFSLKEGVAVESNVVNKGFFEVPENGGKLGRDVWSSSQSQLYFGCSNASHKFQLARKTRHPKHYLLIATSGGLNQQRTGIIDAVVAAYILNATLVIPKLDQKSYWKDDSNFDEIFDVNWFISFLSKDLKIIKELPAEEGNQLTPYSMRVPRKCTPTCYLKRVSPMLNKKHIVQLSKFDYRLSNQLDQDLQKLRCRVNYHALKFTDPIRRMGKLLVERMRKRSKHFVALHLRFEPDMLAFSGCDYGGGDQERADFGILRKRWKTLHEADPEKVRRRGRCPLTPEEIGLMLRALGFGSDVHLYVASGEVYGGESTLAPLKALFPNYHTKESIASKEELAPFLSYSSRMAALDFTVCDESDVFVSNNNGNMARILAGRRRYMGHKPTIRPNGKKLWKFFLNRNNMTWEAFSSRVRKSQIGFMGEPNEVKPGAGEFHENPSSCICEKPEGRERAAPARPYIGNANEDNSEIEVFNEDISDRHVSDDEEEVFDSDYAIAAMELVDNNELSLKGDRPEVEELFLD